MVKKFRKKPIVIEAEQFLPPRLIPAGVMNVYQGQGDIYVGEIQTLEGRMTCMNGDYIITGIKGEKYACKPDIFEATYEEVV